MSKPASPLVVGTFVLSGLAILIVALLALGGGHLLRKRETVEFVSYFRDNVNGLDIGAPVKFMGIEIGAVKDVRIGLSGRVREPADIRIPVIVEIDQRRLTAEGAVTDVRDHAAIARLVEGGLRASLATESLLTGKRYISLEIRPNTPINLVNDPAVPYIEVPSVQGWGSQFQRDVERLVNSLSEIDVARLARRVDEAAGELGPTVREARRFLAAYGPRGPSGRDLSGATRDVARASAQATSALAAIEQLVQPNGTLSLDVAATLTELREAARSLRLLSDRLNRDPGAIVRGNGR